MQHLDAPTLPRRHRPMSNKEIGEVAGEVWNRLAEQNEQSLTGLKKTVDAPADLVLAAVGWLAREDKLEFVLAGRTVKLRLR